MFGLIGEEPKVMVREVYHVKTEPVVYIFLLCICKLNQIFSNNMIFDM